MKPTGFTIDESDDPNCDQFTIELDCDHSGIDLKRGWIGSERAACEAMVAIRLLAARFGWETSEEKLALHGYEA